MAEVKAFRAVRYDPGLAGRLEDLVAPPYDVLSAEERERYLARSPYNVVHLTLPGDEGDAARLWRSWLAEGALVREGEPGFWWLAQDYVGPDGVARRRDGLVCALRAAPYGAGRVLPHERTHAGPKEGRLRLLRALRAHVEPIFLLYEGFIAGPQGAPAVEVELEGVRSRLWRVGAGPPAEVLSATLVIADGHHRYETAVAFAEESGGDEASWLLAVVVPTEQEGLTIFPTHRIAGRVDDLPRLQPQGAVEVYTRRGSGWIGPAPGELETELVARHARDVAYTPHAAEARAAVDEGRAEAAFLLPAPSVEQVASVARAGRTMPQKSTYFFPKLASGLLFLALD